MVLEIINSCLVHQTQHNPNLIYTILYKKEMFELAAKNPAFQVKLILLFTISVIKKRDNNNRMGNQYQLITTLGTLILLCNCVCKELACARFASAKNLTTI